MQEEEYTIPQMVDEVRSGKLPRRRFLKTLTAMGISAAGVGAIAAAASRQVSSASVAKTTSVHEQSREQLRLHDAPEPAERDRQPFCNRAVEQLIGVIVAEQKEPLLVEALDRLRRSGQTLAPTLLPALLEGRSAEDN